MYLSFLDKVSLIDTLLYYTLDIEKIQEEIKMNKKLFLSSSFKDVAVLLPKFKGNLVDKKVAFIPTASIVEEVTTYVETGKKALERLGLVVEELDLSMANYEEIKEKIIESDIIYVTGGNTFFLLQELRRSGADKLITNEVNLGKLYIGESAGAVITAPNIEYIKSMDSPEKALKLTNFNGLELVQFYIVPHYTNQPFIEMTNKIVEDYSTTSTLKTISNNEVILVSGENIVIKSI